MTSRKTVCRIDPERFARIEASLDRIYGKSDLIKLTYLADKLGLDIYHLRSEVYRGNLIAQTGPHRNSPWRVWRVDAEAWLQRTMPHPRAERRAA